MIGDGNVLREWIKPPEVKQGWTLKRARGAALDFTMIAAIVCVGVWLVVGACWGAVSLVRVFWGLMG